MRIQPASEVRIAIISGSVRPDNYTNKALALVIDEFRKHQEVSLDVIDPAKLDLPLPGAEGHPTEAAQLMKLVKNADAILMATPLYNGSYSSVIKVVIDHLGYPSALTGKPVALLGVAASPFGAGKALQHLEEVCTYISATVLPNALSIARVWEVFDEDGRCLDPEIEQQLRAQADQLLDYLEHYVAPRIALEERGQNTRSDLPPEATP